MENTQRQCHRLKSVLPNKHRALLLVAAAFTLTIGSRLLSADTGSCGGQSITLPFTDVPSSNIFFCAIAQAYFTGLTNGTSATTYAPTQPVSREQMAAFIARTQDSALKRGNRRAAMQQWWTPTSAGALRPVDLGTGNIPIDITCDGANLWIANTNATVSRVRASDGKLLQTWTGANGAGGIIAAAGRIYIAGTAGTAPGKVYVIDPAATPGAVTVFEDDIGAGPHQITFDGTNLWTANLSNSGTGSISRIDVATGVDGTFTAGFNFPDDILWDGANLWVADGAFNLLKRIDPANGSVVEEIEVQQAPNRLLFDGTNLWISSRGLDNITVVRATGGLRGTVLASFTVPGGPNAMAFDGERVMVGNFDGDAVSLFKAADFTPLGTVSTGANSGPFSVASDGLNFWIGRANKHDIVRF
jgi:hypothetical protein